MTTVRDNRDNRPDLNTDSTSEAGDNRSVTTVTTAGDNRADGGPLGSMSELGENSVSPRWEPLKGGLPSPQTGREDGLTRLGDAIRLAGFWTWLWGGQWQARAIDLGEPYPISLFAAAVSATELAAMKRINRDFWLAVQSGDRDLLEIVLLEEDMLADHLVAKS